MHNGGEETGLPSVFLQDRVVRNPNQIGSRVKISLLS